MVLGVLYTSASILRRLFSLWALCVTWGPCALLCLSWPTAAGRPCQVERKRSQNTDRVLSPMHSNVPKSLSYMIWHRAGKLMKSKIKAKTTDKVWEGLQWLLTSPVPSSPCVIHRGELISEKQERANDHRGRTTEN